MKLTGEYFIAAPQQEVWDALNDPDILKQCIPGCESLERSADNQFTATATNKIGPVKATFSGEVQLSDINPPHSYKISGEGKGGAAGFAKGGADVHLSEADGGTTLRYDVDAKVGGKLAQLGQRLVDTAAKKMADDFFKSFAEIVGPAPVETTDTGTETATASSASSTPPGKLLIAVGVAAIIALIIYFAAR